MTLSKNDSQAENLCKCNNNKKKTGGNYCIETQIVPINYTSRLLTKHLFFFALYYYFHAYFFPLFFYDYTTVARPSSCYEYRKGIKFRKQ